VPRPRKSKVANFRADYAKHDERFVFVMSILERYSYWDCSRLLECSMKKVAQARIGALRQLPGVAPSCREAMNRHFVV